MNTLCCQVAAVYRINLEVVRVQLTCPYPIAYQAGQYLELLIPGESHCYFSIANAPGTCELELHIQRGMGDSSSDRIIDWLERFDQVDVVMPLGQCTLEALPQEPGPLLLIAAGTGFSQIKAIAECLMKQSLTRQVHLYWSARTVSGLYMADLPEEWHRVDPNFHFSAIISEHNEWQDKQGLMVKAILEDFDDLGNCQAICCGSPAMVYATLDGLVGHGLRADHMIADVFDYAPRTE